jgi:hypothetical protein
MGSYISQDSAAPGNRCMRQARRRRPAVCISCTRALKHRILDITCLWVLSGGGFCDSGRRREPLPESVLACPSLSRNQLPPPDDSNFLFLFLILVQPANFFPFPSLPFPSLCALSLAIPSCGGLTILTPPPSPLLSHLPAYSVATIESAPFPIFHQCGPQSNPPILPLPSPTLLSTLPASLPPPYGRVPTARALTIVFANRRR